MTPSRTRQPLLSGSRDGLTTLGAFGRRVYRLHPQVRSLIARRFGDRHAMVLAEPLEAGRASDDQRIDWYAPVAGDVIARVDLPPAEGDLLDAELARILADLRDFARELESRPGHQQEADLVRHTTAYPGIEYVFSVAGQPVVTFWGFELDNPERARMALIRDGLAGTKPAPAVDSRPLPPPVQAEAATAAPVSPTPEPARDGRRAWWWWLLPVALLLLLLLAWLRARGEDPLGLLRGCGQAPIVPGPTTTPTPSATVEHEPVTPTPASGGEAVVSPAETSSPTPGPSASVGPGRPDSAGEAATDAGRGEGETDTQAESEADRALPSSEVPPPDEAPSPGATGERSSADDQPNAEPPGAPTEPSDGPESPEAKEEPVRTPAPLVLPTGKPATDQPDFMEGRWRTETPLHDPQGRGVTVDYDFDQRGRGAARIKRKGMPDCTGPVQATWKDGRVRIKTVGPTKCPGGVGFDPHQITCSPDPEGRADCVMTQPRKEPMDVTVLKLPDSGDGGSRGGGAGQSGKPGSASGGGTSRPSGSAGAPTKAEPRQPRPSVVPPRPLPRPSAAIPKPPVSTPESQPESDDGYE